MWALFSWGAAVGGVHAAGSATHTGIWKAFVPADAVGEFDSHDPVGLIAGKRIRADCSLNWRDGQGRMYCFSSGTSLVHFLDQPQTNTQRARQAWARLCGDAGRTESCD